MNRLFRRSRAAFFCTWIAVTSACSTARNDQTSPDEPPEPSPAATLQARATVGSSRIGDSLVPESGNGGYDVESYDLLLAFDAADQPMKGRANIVASATQDLSAFYLDLHGLTVEQVEVDGAQARFERTGDELLITPTNALAVGTRFATTVRYAGIPEGVKDPSAPVDSIGWLASDGEIYVFSQPNGAMSYFPCNDHPKDKALFTISIDVPRPLEAVANGALVETIEQSERRTFVWKARDLMATYLVTIAIADFEEQELVGPDGLRIVNYFTQSSRERSRTPFARTPAMIEFLSASFGPYPFEIAGNILSNVSIGLALETQTKPVYGRGAGSESTICHELAHQWFGNAVCVEDWDDIWINEGISEYAAWMYLEHTKGQEAFEKELVRNYGLARFANATPPGKPEVTEMFGLGMYVRGPLALHSVRAAIGDERFLTLMRTWVAAHLHGNASLEQFLEHVQSQSDASVRATLERWLFDETMPSVPAWDDQVAAEKMKRDADREARRKTREEEKAKQKEADAQKKDG